MPHTRVKLRHLDIHENDIIITLRGIRKHADSLFPRHRPCRSPSPCISASQRLFPGSVRYLQPAKPFPPVRRATEAFFIWLTNPVPAKTAARAWVWRCAPASQRCTARSCASKALGSGAPPCFWPFLRRRPQNRKEGKAHEADQKCTALPAGPPHRFRWFFGSGAVSRFLPDYTGRVFSGVKQEGIQNAFSPAPEAKSWCTPWNLFDRSSCLLLTEAMQQDAVSEPCFSAGKNACRFSGQGWGFSGPYRPGKPDSGGSQIGAPLPAGNQKFPTTSPSAWPWTAGTSAISTRSLWTASEKASPWRIPAKSCAPM